MLQNTMDEQQQPVESTPVVPPVPDPVPIPSEPQPQPAPIPAPPAVPIPPAPQPQTPSGNTGMAILAYLGILIVVPFLTEAKNDPFVKFHLKQGLALIITEIIFFVVQVFIGIFLSALRLGILGLFIYPILWILGLGFLILTIVGIINAATGKQKELPIIGQFARNFNF